MRSVEALLARMAVTVGALLCAAPTVLGQTAPAGAVETGALAGANYRIEMPARWNHQLVIYAHGYRTVRTPRLATNWDDMQQPALRSEFLSRGFAIAQTEYRTDGWAVKEAVEDLEALRLHFIRQHGRPAKTYIAGHSLGGLLTVITLEQRAGVYAGGLALCGPYLPALTVMTDSLFSMLVTFDALFPNVLHLGHDGVLDPAATAPPTSQAIGAALKASPEQALRYAARFREKPEAVPFILAFYREILRELVARAGGNPFDNTGTVYAGFGDDARLNREVGRYAANPSARAYLVANGSTTGRHTDPILAVHTTDDPIVDPEYANLYDVESTAAGSPDLFVQRFVVASGHCAIPAPLIGAAFDDLVAWVEKKTKPAAGEQHPPPAPAVQ
jgi:pimeloyl-ACP methyl ester carboxylesterase